MRYIAEWAELPNRDPRFLCLYFGSSVSADLYIKMAKLSDFAVGNLLDIDQVYARIIHAWRTRAEQHGTHIVAGPVFAGEPPQGVTWPPL